MNAMLNRDFFERDTRIVAKELIGKWLYRKTPTGIYRALIAETEAYHGQDDLGCHCSKGVTPRTKVMFGPPGHIYVYLIYGMYEMLNFVTMPEGFPAAVLIRGLYRLEFSTSEKSSFQPLHLKTDGPGKLTRTLKITRNLNSKKLHPETGIWIENAGIEPGKIITTPRIGIDYAKEWKHKPWRYVAEFS